MGTFELIVGCMFAGKTSELIRRIKREHVAHKKVVLFKPKLDSRYDPNKVSTHDQLQLHAEVVQNTQQLRDYLANNPVDVVGIDEIQFFDEPIIAFCQSIVKDKTSKIKIIAGGLSRDFRSEPFSFLHSKRHIGELMPLANTILVLRAICTHKDEHGTCGRDADYTQRLINGKPAKYDDPIVLVGSQESYEARCGTHHFVEK